MKKSSLILLLMLSSCNALAGGIDTELSNVWSSLGGSSVSNSANYGSVAAIIDS